MFTTSSNAKQAAAVFQLANSFSSRLQEFLSDFLLVLDQYIDKRLVATFEGLCSSIIRLRSRSSGLLLSELGGYLLSFDKATAGTKRISNLLRSKKWSYELIVDHLALQAQQYVDKLLAKKEKLMLLIWDESIQEKPESLESEGLCAVRSSKAGRLLRIKRGYYDPPTKKAVHVPGLRWVGLLLSSLHHQPMIAHFRWWSSRGKQCTTLKQVRFELLQWTREHFADALLHVFDRGYASREWLGLLLAKADRFLLRWPSRYKLLDAKGNYRKACYFSVGRKASSSKLLWDARSRSYLRRSLLWMPCLHAEYADYPLTLIICRPGKKGRQPWYLLTNEPVDNDKDAWLLVLAYAKRWQIEQSFRFSKSELAMESCRLWFWDNKMKLLMMVTLVYAFLLSLLDEQLKDQRDLLLQWGCPRTGKRCRQASTPLYRVRLALANLLNLLYFSSFQNSG